MNISIFGCGYVGLVTGACFADLGNNVSCYDVDKKKISSLNRGIVPFHEPGLDQLISKNAQNKKISFSSDIKDCINFSSVLFICVGTPQKNNGEPNLSYINDCISTILEHSKQNEDEIKHIFIKSTVPPGTIKRLQKMIKDRNLQRYFSVSSNPEFLKEGSAINDFLKPDRVVIGSNDGEAIRFSRVLYRPIVWKSDRMLVVSPESSETIKYASNAFLAMKISFINEIAKLSDAIGADINEIRRGVGLDERINPNFLYAGIGYGGSCFPKDVQGLTYAFKSNNLSENLISATIKVNNLQIQYFLNKIFSTYSKNDLKSKTFAVWGQSFKPNTDDIRESVGIKLVHYLAPYVKKLKVFEPIAIKNTKLAHKDIANITFSKSAGSAIDGSHALIICTEYREFWNFDLQILAKLHDLNIFDGRNILDKKSVQEMGINYFGIGR